MNDMTEAPPVGTDIQNPLTGSMLEVISRAASDPAVDIDKLERLIAVQQQIQEKQSEAEFNSALARAQAAMPRVVKTRVNAQTKSEYAAFEDVIGATASVIHREGLSVSFSQGDPASENHIRTIIEVRHSGGHLVRHWMELPVDNVGTKGNATKTTLHGIASTTTYAKRYLFCGVFGIAPEGMDQDGNIPSQEVQLITENQAIELHALITDNGLDIAQWLDWIEQRTGERSFDSIPSASFGKVRDVILKRIKSGGGAE